ncbi:unnamed protein product [Thelazia callipaeda]|uniref:EF-hand domain-containing protein n=1 Tax=Thelazia callipaeda TaxID=103827 RepID=A0A0N5CLY8_THECL|nr:unnamed protein product [Thelazia callipaeda]
MKLLVVFLAIIEKIIGESKSEIITTATSPLHLSISTSSIASAVPVEITPIPADDFSPRLDEFRRIDANGDQYITFAEMILADRPYIESKSRIYHKQDLNGIILSIISYKDYLSDRIKSAHAVLLPGTVLFQEIKEFGLHRPDGSTQGLLKEIANFCNYVSCDGIVSKDEFIAYHRKIQEERRSKEQQAENFFKQLQFGFGFPQNSLFSSNGRLLQGVI